MSKRTVTLADFPESRRLDVQVLNTIYGFPLHKIYAHDAPEWLYWIPSGKPSRTHRIDARPVPDFSRGDAFQIIERLCVSDGPQVILWREGPNWWAEFSLEEQRRAADDKNVNVAICLAALRWVAGLRAAGVAVEGAEG